MLGKVKAKVSLVVLAVVLVAAPSAALAIHNFDDVPDSHTFHNDIQWMLENGITAGCGGSNYCPDSYVTRGQMAAFMKRLASKGIGGADGADGAAACAVTLLWNLPQCQTATVTVGTNPVGVAFDGNNMWVTNWGDGTVSKINVSTDTVTATVTVGTNPRGVAFDGSNIWVANNGDGTVSKVDVSTDTVTATVTVGTNPVGVAFDGNNIWVTNANDGTVSKIDVSTDTVTATVTVGTGPRGVAFDGSNIWITNNGDGTVSKIVP
jgi:YVTN family beta-propeller protein